MLKTDVNLNGQIARLSTLARLKTNKTLKNIYEHNRNILLQMTWYNRIVVYCSRPFDNRHFIDILFVCRYLFSIFRSVKSYEFSRIIENLMTLYFYNCKPVCIITIIYSHILNAKIITLFRLDWFHCII